MYSWGIVRAKLGALIKRYLYYDQKTYFLIDTNSVAVLAHLYFAEWGRFFQSIQNFPENFCTDNGLLNFFRL